MSVSFEFISDEAWVWVQNSLPRKSEGLVRQARAAGFVARVVRGKKMRTTPDLFNEFSAAFQFPYYFGENWDAFDECISDIDWMPVDVGVVIVIRDAVQVLTGEHDNELSILEGAFEVARETYAEPIERGEAWDRPAMPFHVVLQAEPDDVPALTQRWTAAGATLVPLPD